MKHLLLVLALALTGVGCSSLIPSYLDEAGLSPYTRYRQFETAHFKFAYQEGYFDFAERAATHIEHAHEILSPLLKWQPRSKIQVTVADNIDSANGFAAPALRVGIMLNATPPDAWESTSYSDDWIKLLVFHEYVHVLNMDPTTEWIEGLRILFGDGVRPNSLWPSWMLEGLAVYYETRTSNLGRGRSPYYEAVLRALIMDNKLDIAKNKNGEMGITLDRVNGDFPGFPGGEIRYLLGYEMWNQVTRSYPELNQAESAVGQVSLNSASRVPFFINGNQENVTGKTWYEYWDLFVQQSRDRLGPQIEKIRKTGESEFETISKSDYSALGGAISPDSKWLAYNKSFTARGRTGLYLQNLADRKEIRITDKIDGVGLAFTPDSKQLIYNSLVNFNTYQSFSDLFIYDLEQKSITRLTEGLRAKDPTLSPDGKTVAFIKVQHGTHTLWTAQLTSMDGKPQLTSKKVVYRPKNFAILGTPKFLDADHLAFSEQSLGLAKSDIRNLSLSKNEVRDAFSDGSMNRSIATDQGMIYFVSNKNGIENIYRLDSNSNAVRVTHVATGTALPFIAPNGDLWASRLTSVGYQIGRFTTVNRSTAGLPSDAAVVSAPNAPAPLAAALAEPQNLSLTESQTEKYSPWSSLAPRAWAPIAYFGYSSISGAETGGLIMGFDTSGKHQYFGLLGYKFKTRTFEPLINYTYYGFRPAVTLNVASESYDIAADSTRLYFKQTNSVALGFSFPIRWTFSSLTPSLYFSEEWNGVYEISDHDRVGTTDPDFNRNQIPVIGSSLHFRNVERSRYGFMTERGDEITLQGQGRQYDKNYANWKYLVSYQHYFQVGDHSVLTPKVRWLGSSRTDSNVERFYSRARGKVSSDLSSRGTSTSLNSLGIRGYLMDNSFYTRATGVVSLDYHFPLDQIFRGPGTFPLFFKQAHAFVFFDTIFIPSARLGNLFLPSFGAGVTFDTQALLFVPIAINFEMQNGTRKDFGGEQNFFLSLESNGLF